MNKVKLTLNEKYVLNAILDLGGSCVLARDISSKVLIPSSSVSSSLKQLRNHKCINMNKRKYPVSYSITDIGKLALGTKEEVQPPADVPQEETPKEETLDKSILENLTSEIYDYFKEHNARLSEEDAARIFADHSAPYIKKAFSKVTYKPCIQYVGSVDGCKVYGYSKDGSSLAKTAYWVRTPIKIKEEGFARIPVQMFKGFLSSQSERKSLVRKMLYFAVYDRTLYTKSAERACKFLRISFDNPDNAARRGEDIGTSIRTRSYLYVNVHKLIEISNDDQYTNEQATLWLMFYVLGSVQGNSPYSRTTNDFLLSRMDGNDTRVDPSEWSAEIQTISTRRKLDRLKRLVSQYYNVSFFGAHVRGFYFSTKLKEGELMAALAAPRKSKQKKKETKTQAQKFAEMKAWLVENNMTLDQVLKLADKRREDERSKKNGANSDDNNLPF